MLLFPGKASASDKTTASNGKYLLWLLIKKVALKRVALKRAALNCNVVGCTTCPAALDQIKGIAHLSAKLQKAPVCVGFIGQVSPAGIIG